MRKRFKVRNYKHPRLKFVVNYREAGKRKRTFFETKEQAQSFADLKTIELRNAGIEGSEFSSKLRVMAQECAELLSGYGKTLKDATDFLVAHLKASERSITVAALVTQLIAAKKADGVSAIYILDLQYRLSCFAREFGDQVVATITATQIDNWLRGLQLSATSRNNFRRVLTTTFSYAIAHGYATSNPAASAAMAKVIDKPPGILNVQQAARLLESATPDILPCVAIGLFAGLRRAEIDRLDWSDVHFDDGLIEVTAAKSKTARRRFVKIQPNLREWLMPRRKHRGQIVPTNFREQFERARIAAGITDWPANALRHSFASYHLAHFKDASALALEMGHTDNGMIFNHYRQLVRPKEAERYWNVRPARIGKKIVQM